jgi:hypothetical protein
VLLLGQFDDPVIRRLSLPTHLWMVVAVLAVLPQFPRPAVVRTLLGVVILGILAQGVPSMAAHAYNQEYLAGLETAWRRQFIADQPRKDYLMIDNDSILWIAHQVSATTGRAATTAGATSCSSCATTRSRTSTCSSATRSTRTRAR